ncbi:hypothetical protein VNO78_26208 [Psophocarpus tetragonolobus]|uniref:BHLH domain-containing protein n=1 Tax=Psophocarpus tetragonolobus TaxID=3891 RepID=A0AAN9X8M7_PSOTE
MDESWEKWFSELEMEMDHDIDQIQRHLVNEQEIISSLEEELNGENSDQLAEISWDWESCSLSCDSILNGAATSNNNSGNNNGSSSLEENTTQNNANSIENQAFSSYNLSFEDSTAVPNILNNACQYYAEHCSKETVHDQTCNNKRTKRDRSNSQTQDHIMAERKRREKLSTMFIALSAIIPGLKKMDKLSIVSNAIDYVKYLQNRVKDLEEQNKKTESVMCFKNNISNNVEEFSGISDCIDSAMTFPNVEARVSAKDILIRVICDKEKDIVPKLMSKIATYHLSIVCSNVMTFGNSTLNISITAKVEREFSMTIDDLVKKLNEDLLRFCNWQQ